VRTRNESKQARDTHVLEGAEGNRKKARERGTLTAWRAQRETNEDMVKKRGSEEHSLPGESIRSDK